ncbi:hypothetical protein JW979_11560, partial [bacterium]|nr:hypothetical protein [candidate division CSSED10-310 bacterium]
MERVTLTGGCKMKKLIWILATGFVTLFSVVFGQSPFPETGQGSLYAFSEENGQQTYLEIPLKHTVVNAEISGFIARVDVRQEFFNSEDHPIEAIYVFPLPDNAAVDQMNMIIGTRVVKGVIKERSEAEMLYQQARHHGNTASLLTQERPNIFTQSITNIAPGDKITIAISYVQDITYDHGEYEFNFPMVVGPRFIPGNPIGKTGGGWALDTTDVPDASKITPPVLKPGMRSGHDIRILLDIDTGYPIKYIHSPSHNIMVESTDSYYAVVELQ